MGESKQMETKLKESKEEKKQFLNLVETERKQKDEQVKEK